MDQATDRYAYLNERLRTLGITEEANSFVVADDSPKGWHEEPFFRPDQEGNILISYLTLTGEVQMYPAGASRTEKPYRAKRLKNPQGKRKYYAPSGAPTHIFHTPGVIEKCLQGKDIETYCLVEGQFKAFKGNLHGLDIDAINGIWNFRQKQSMAFKADLHELLTLKQVKNLVLLHDADARQITFAPDEELTTRLWDFYRSVRTFREITKQYELDFYFAHVKEDLAGQPKGLDDVYAAYPGEEEAISQDFLKLGAAETYFTCLNLTACSERQLKSHFFLSSVEAFYRHFKNQIGHEVFRWNGGKYQWNEESESVEMLRHPDCFKFLRIGTEYYKEIEVVNSKNEINTQLRMWKKGEIIQDYVKGLKLKSFIDWIEKYDTFTNVPDHTAKFQKVIRTPNGSLAYNQYHPLEHQPEAGDWATIKAFLKHVFGEEEAPSGHPRYLMGLDYLTLLYRKPWQKLPIIILVNEAHGTGKSTFIFLLMAIFGSNASFCGNDDLTDSFNSSWVTKLLCCIDEGVIDKKIVWEKVKAMTTGPKHKLHAKGRDKEETDLFVKFIFTSNDEDHCVPVSPNERRVWALKVPRYEGPDNGGLLEQMKREIPAFLHHLGERELVHPRRGQLWFDRSELRTPALERLVRGGRSWVERELHEQIRDYLLDFQEPEVYLTMQQVELLVNQRNRYQRFEIKKVLEQKWKLRPKNSSYLALSWAGTGENRSKVKTREKGRYYTFQAQQFLHEDELATLGLNDE